VTDRRSFLATIVRAEPTVFRANPDGRQVLVRFYVTDVDALAGRLRVYDQRRRLLGTAGVIRSGNGLYGELWLPLGRETTVQSELEIEPPAAAAAPLDGLLDHCGRSAPARSPARAATAGTARGAGADLSAIGRDR
jgi:hypothetical protein